MTTSQEPKVSTVGYFEANPSGYDSAPGLGSAPPTCNVLEEAQQIIYGDREETYGDPGKNLRHIAAQWSLYLHQKYSIHPALISAEDVCYMMADLKKCRQLHQSKRDNLVDGIGYLALTERI